MFAKLFRKKFSHSTAKNRLQMVLVQDRSGLGSQDMDEFKKDILDVISKYFVLENTSVDVNWERGDGTTSLVINTPVIGRPKVVKKAVA